MAFIRQNITIQQLKTWGKQLEIKLFISYEDAAIFMKKLKSLIQKQHPQNYVTIIKEIFQNQFMLEKLYEVICNNELKKNWEHESLKNSQGFADIKICTVPVKENEPYEFNTYNQCAIWFSLKPDIAIRDKEKECLLKRKDNRGSNILIYSSAILHKKARDEISSFSQDNNITLFDIDKIKVDELSATSRELLKLAKLELQSIQNGGNPAAASDIIRWIPEIMNDCVYADIDLATCTFYSKPAIPMSNKSGLPVVLNMGSIISETGQKGPFESCTVNTDIIGYSKSPDRIQFMEAVATNIIDAYSNPFGVLKHANAEICKTQAFHEINSRHGTLFDLRMAVTNCNTILDFYHFLGPKLFMEKFNLEMHDEIIKKLEIASLAKETKKLDPVLEQFQAREEIVNLMKVLVRDYYKPLVTEISGPGIVYQAMGGDAVLVQPYRPTDNPSVPLRAIQLYGCVNGISSFVSDNIVHWEVREENLSKLQINPAGLSWVPNKYST